MSSAAFLQIHIEMCEVLYGHIIEAVAEADVVLDLGCGIGTIGLSVLDRLRKQQSRAPRVIGVEICAEAVQDAKVNAQSVEGYEVHLGKAEDKIK